MNMLRDAVNGFLTGILQAVGYIFTLLVIYAGLFLAVAGALNGLGDKRHRALLCLLGILVGVGGVSVLYYLSGKSWRKTFGLLIFSLLEP